MAVTCSSRCLKAWLRNFLDILLITATASLALPLQDSTLYNYTSPSMNTPNELYSNSEIRYPGGVNNTLNLTGVHENPSVEPMEEPTIDFRLFTEEHDRRMQQRADATLSSLHHFEVVVPTLVDHQGDFISYDVTDQYHVRMRAKRSIRSTDGNIQDNSTSTQQDPGLIFYQLDAYGKKFHLNLTLNKELVAPRYTVEYRGRGGVEHKHRSLRECHYYGYLTSQQESSRVALSNCHGLHGVVLAGSEEYFVEPLWNDTWHDRETRGHYHVVYKRSAIKAFHPLPNSRDQQPHCGVNDSSTSQPSYSSSPLPASTSSEAPSSASIPSWWLHHQEPPGAPGLHPPAQDERQHQQQASVMYHQPPNIATPSHLQNIKHKWQRRRRRRESDPTNVKDSSSREVTHRGRSKRSVSVERHVETLVVVDKMMVAYHGKGDIEPYVLTVMNIVAKLYHDASIGNTINMIVTRLVLLTEDQKNLEITHHADRSLESFCLWQQSINPSGEEGDEGLAHHDNAVLLTRYDICTYKNEPCGTLGLAPVAGMCEPDRSCSINEDIGLASAFTIAHEIGHNFGMQHDGSGNTCGLPGKEPAKIMAAQLTKDTIPFSWSDCSRDYITAFLDSGRGKCLENLPPEQDFNFPDEMPGQAHDADTQCQYQYGSRSRHCKAVELCRELWCINPSDKCVTNSIPAAEGTTCTFKENGTETGWCYEGACVEFGWRAEAVDGGWGRWSAWGACTRTCGGGVEASQRHCNNPLPKHGGRYCIGERKRYRSCNINDCAINATDFREVQCSKYNDVRFRGKYYKWKTFSGEEKDIEAGQVKPCALNCLAVGFNFYTERAPKVVDGTRCYPDTKDVCINGECKSVGCDGVLGSNAVEDRCRVCGGDGNMCETIKGTFNIKLQDAGDSYEKVVVIPQGAVHIKIEEMIISRNYLALKSVKDDKYYINGAWTIDWPRKFEVANTIFHYERPKDEVETLYALGPTSEDLVITILLQEENLGISYQYNMASNNVSHNTTEFVWQSTPWSECSKPCAKGVSQSLAVCVRKDDGTMVKNKYCVANLKPDDRVKSCNVEPCAPRWEIGEWGDCSKTCDGGAKTRTVLCIQKIDDKTVKEVQAKRCGKKKPRWKQRCKSKKCPPHWATDSWSECRPRCGYGSKTRNVYCVSAKGNYLEDENCKAVKKPPNTQKCHGKQCPAPKWVTGKWGKCSAQCGQGQQRRSVACRDHKHGISSGCPPTLKPHGLQACHTDCTADTDNTTGDCQDVNKVAYCPLVLKFKFCERAYFHQMCCKTCTLHGFSLKGG